MVDLLRRNNLPKTSLLKALSCRSGRKFREPQHAVRSRKGRPGQVVVTPGVMVTPPHDADC